MANYLLGTFWQVSALYLVSVVAPPRMDLVCSEPRRECTLETRQESVGREVTYEVSCTCRFPETKDVAQILHDLARYRRACPKIPWQEGDSPVHTALLSFDGCSVKDLVFPISILRSLRRSKNFILNITNAESLRLPSDNSDETAPDRIDAFFEHSFISGLPSGWVSNAVAANITVHSSDIGIIEAGFATTRTDYGSLNIKIINSNVTTISNLAFKLPSRGKMEITGSRVQLLSNKAVEGGDTLKFEGLHIGNIQPNSINIYGLKELTLDASIIAEIGRNALYESVIAGRSEEPTGEERQIQSVSITGNKILKLDGKAFSGLCHERKMSFHNNIIKVVNPPLTLMKSSCGAERNWISSISENGFVCDSCSGLADDLNEQVCSLYSSAWCLCDNEVSIMTLDTRSSNSSASSTYSIENQSNKPCQSPFADYLAQCYANQFENIQRRCQTLLKELESRYELSGRALSFSKSSPLLPVDIVFIVLVSSVLPIIFT